MGSSTKKIFPVHDEPTREGTAADGSDGGFDFDSEPTEADAAAIPDRVGDYAVKCLIGRGGMGRVYLAEHTRMQRIVALKTLPIERMKDAEAVERFYDEVRAASKLLHPNIVTAFDAGDAAGVHYLAMEYVDGWTLTETVSQRGPMSVGEAASVIRQAALGLLHAHRANIVHRDVKPGNLMRTADGTVKVLDLGLARISNLQLESAVDAAVGRTDSAGQASRQRARSNQTVAGNQTIPGTPRSQFIPGSPAQTPAAPRANRMVGTLPFMSPEQLEDPESADARSDIYSLGATLYFLLTARPPFGGELLDQIYGHRHGDIPDLMQQRNDVDLSFSHIFQRMMAKSPGARYASLDEVIEELSRYADPTATPSWLTEFTDHPLATESSTFSGGSTSTRASHVVGLDLGMFYAAAAEATAGGEITPLLAGGADQPLLRMAIGSFGDQLLFGNEAIARREDRSGSVVHCLPMYLGQPLVEREIAGRKCPPEVLLAMLCRRMVRNAWPGKAAVDAIAITVPASYDQLHRRSLLQAAKMAGFPAVRLVDRSLAATQTLLLDSHGDRDSDDSIQVDGGGDENVLFIGLVGQASEVAVIRRGTTRLEQLATTGHWHTGSLAWLHQLVDLSAEMFRNAHGIDPRNSQRHAIRLQIACERAVHALLLLPEVQVTIQINGQPASVSVSRQRWLRACERLLDGLRHSIELACQRASISVQDIDRCVLLGPMLRLDAIRDPLLAGLRDGVPVHRVDRSETARGAAACIAGELPGRRDLALPPRGVTSQSIGIVVEDARGRRRILPVIPRGTSLPARTNRRLTVGSNRETMTLSLVESSGVNGEDWHSLGRYDFELGSEAAGSTRRTRMIGFEIDVNGLLTVRAQQPGSPGSKKLAALPAPTLPDASLSDWIDWINERR